MLLSLLSLQLILPEHLHHLQDPDLHHLLQVHLLLRVKRNPDGSVERYKGRVVAKGFSQKPGIDYEETFSPTAKWAALRAILALGALEDMEIESVDISSAFLNGELDKDITMNVFEGLRDMRPHLFKDGPKRDSDWVLELHTSLYGLKQSPRQWYKKLHSVMCELGFERVQCDNSIWMYKKDSTRIIVPVYVDDMTIVAKNKSDVAWVRPWAHQLSSWSPCHQRPLQTHAPALPEAGH